MIPLCLPSAAGRAVLEPIAPARLGNNADGNPDNLHLAKKI
jgi:hypothetical protein